MSRAPDNVARRIFVERAKRELKAGADSPTCEKLAIAIAQQLPRRGWDYDLDFDYQRAGAPVWLRDKLLKRAREIAS